MFELGITHGRKKISKGLKLEIGVGLSLFPYTHTHVRRVLSFDLPVRPIRQAQGPEALEGQAQGPDPSTMLRVMVRYSNHEALEGEAPLGLSSGRRLDRWYGVKVVVHFALEAKDS